jgi:hypothetical protein
LRSASPSHWQQRWCSGRIEPAISSIHGDIHARVTLRFNLHPALSGRLNVAFGTAISAPAIIRASIATMLLFATSRAAPLIRAGMRSLVTTGLLVTCCLF